MVLLRLFSFLVLYAPGRGLMASPCTHARSDVAAQFLCFIIVTVVAGNRGFHFQSRSFFRGWFCSLLLHQPFMIALVSTTTTGPCRCQAMPRHAVRFHLRLLFSFPFPVRRILLRALLRHACQVIVLERTNTGRRRVASRRNRHIRTIRFWGVIGEGLYGSCTTP